MERLTHLMRTSAFIVIIVGLLVVQLIGCKKSVRRKKLRCQLPKTMLTKLAAKRTVDLDEDQRKRWLRLLESSCRPWPGYIRQYIRYRVDPDSVCPTYDLNVCPTLWERADYRRDMKKLCPGYERVFNKLGAYGPVGARHLLDRLYKRCNFHRMNLFGRDVFWRNQALAFVVVTLQRELLRAGIEPKLARKLSQLLLHEDRLAQKCRDLGITLPTSASYTEIPSTAVAISVAPDGIRIGGKRVPVTRGAGLRAKAPQPGATPPVIPLLLKHLTAEIRRRQRTKQPAGRGSPLPLVLLIDNRIRYAVLAGVLATVFRAGFTWIQLASRRPAGDLMGPIVYRSTAIPDTGTPSVP